MFGMIFNIIKYFKVKFTKMARKRLLEVNPLFASFIEDETRRLGISAEKVFAKTGISRSAFWSVKKQ